MNKFIFYKFNFKGKYALKQIAEINKLVEVFQKRIHTIENILSNQRVTKNLKDYEINNYIEELRRNQSSMHSKLSLRKSLLELVETFAKEKLQKQNRSKIA